MPFSLRFSVSPSTSVLNFSRIAIELIVMKIFFPSLVMIVNDLAVDSKFSY